MATEVKRRRGTTIEHSTFTGAVAELTVDLTKDTVVVHDGATQGGFPLLREDFSNVPTTAPFTNISLDTAIFDTTYTETGSETQGTLYWNSDEETLSLVTNGESIELGQKLEIHVKNQTGAQINKGEVVYASGTVGASGRILVTKMIADGTVAAKRVVGVAAENIANGADGKVVHFGKIRQLNTNSFNEGDILWVSTATAGAFQNTEPVQADGDLALPIAFVVTKSINNGELFVRINAIDENEYQDYDAGLQDISGLTPSDSTIIVGDGTNWVAESGDTARASLGLTIGTHVQAWDAQLDTLSGLSADQAQDLLDITAAEYTQLQNIDSVTISNTQWGYLGALDQSLTTGSNVTFNIINVSDSITDASTTYSAGIIGAGTIYDMDDGNGSFFEVDNMRVRNELRAHVFKKDIVKASNAYLFITDSAEIAETSVIVDTTDTFRVLADGSNASFAHGDLLWAKNIDDDGSLQVTGVKIEVSVQPQFVWDTSTETWNTSTITPDSYTEFASGTVTGGIHDGKTYTEYNIYEVTSGGTLNAGDTIVRVSGASILNDASSAQSPFIDIYDGVQTWAQFQDVSKTKVRLGNLAGVSNASGYGLYTQNAFLTGALVVGDLTKASNYLEYSDGNLNGVFNDIDFDSNTFTLETTNLRIDSSDEIIQIGSGDWVQLGRLASTEYGLGLNSNNYWKYNTLTGAYFFKVGSATNFISFNTSNGTLDIETDTFDLNATTLVIDSGTNSGKIALGATPPTAYNSGTGIYFDGTGKALIGDATGNKIQFDGTNVSIQSTSFNLESSSVQLGDSIELSTSEITTTYDYTGSTLVFSGLFNNTYNYFGYLEDVDDINPDGYVFRVGDATNFMELNTSNNVAKINFDTFDLTSGNLRIKSSGTTYPSASANTEVTTADVTDFRIATLGSGFDTNSLAISNNRWVKFQFDYSQSVPGSFTGGITVTLEVSTDNSTFTDYGLFSDTRIDFNTKYFVADNATGNRLNVVDLSDSTKTSFRFKSSQTNSCSGTITMYFYVNEKDTTTHIRFNVLDSAKDATDSLPAVLTGALATNIGTRDYNPVTELNPSGIFTRLSDSLILSNGNTYIDYSLIT